MLLSILLFYGLFHHSKCQEIDSVSSKITDTLKMSIRIASRFLNAKGNIGSSFFKSMSPMPLDSAKEKGGDEREKNFLVVFLRLMGIDSSKVKDYAFSGLISVAQLISLVLTTNGTTDRREGSSTNFSPFRFIMNLPQVVEMLTQIQDPILVDLILNEVHDNLKQYPAEDVDCIRLLICKTSPFVRGMQKSLRFFMKRDKIRHIEGQEASGHATGKCQRKGSWTFQEERCSHDDEKAEELLWERSTLEDRMYFFVPSLKEVLEYGDKCEERFPNCVY